MQIICNSQHSIELEDSEVRAFLVCAELPKKKNASMTRLLPMLSAFSLHFLKRSNHHSVLLHSYCYTVLCYFECWASMTGRVSLQLSTRDRRNHSNHISLLQDNLVIIINNLFINAKSAFIKYSLQFRIISIRLQ
jgi:hypothetical protein